MISKEGTHSICTCLYVGIEMVPPFHLDFRIETPDIEWIIIDTLLTWNLTLV